MEVSRLFCSHRPQQPQALLSNGATKFQLGCGCGWGPGLASGGQLWPGRVAGRVQAGTEAEVAGNRFRKASGPTVVCLLTFDSGAHACSSTRKNCVAAAKASEVIVNIVNCRHGCSRHFWPGKVNWCFTPTKHEFFPGGEIWRGVGLRKHRKKLYVSLTPSF